MYMYTHHVMSANSTSKINVCVYIARIQNSQFSDKVLPKVRVHVCVPRLGGLALDVGDGVVYPWPHDKLRWHSSSSKAAQRGGTELVKVSPTASGRNSHRHPWVRH